MAKKNALGRGLDELLAGLDEEQVVVSEIELTKLDRNPEQPRRQFDETALKSLSESIQTSGVLVPLLVVAVGDRFRIVAGERRFRAAKLAGLTTVPCIVRDMDKQREMEATLVENLQREGLNPIEEAIAIKALMEQFGYTQETAAKRLGKSRPALANLLRLLNLEDEIKTAVASGRLSAGHARTLLAVEDSERRVTLFKKTIDEDLSVRALEALVHGRESAKPAKSKKTIRVLAPELKDMQDRLQSAVGVRTVFSGNEKNGRVVISYTNKDELDLIYAALEVLEKK